MSHPAQPPISSPAQDRPSTDLDERFLLTPPAIENGPPDPFDKLKSYGVPLHSPSHLMQLLEQNARAHKQNSQVFHSNNGSPPEMIDTDMLSDLHLRTGAAEIRRANSTASTDSYTDRLPTSTSADSLTVRIPSSKNLLHTSAGSVSPGSVVSSPMLAAMLDITPLPSPTIGPTEWKALANRSRSRASSTSSVSALPLSSAPSTSPRKKSYGALHVNRKSSLSEGTSLADMDFNDQSRSVSDYRPDPTPPARPRNIAVSGGPPAPVPAPQSILQREDFLGIKRGITHPDLTSLPTFHAPYSPKVLPAEERPAPKRAKVDIWSAQSIKSGNTRNYKTMRPLGQGTFSKVYLAVRQVQDRNDSIDYNEPSVDMAGVRARSRRLVAIKVVEPGPAGGADAERIEVSLQREVELMKRVHHPSIIHLKAFGTDTNGRALLVMNYCPGGDLFELASTSQHVLTPSLIRRIFAELVSAVRYLHQKYIVHRDIKLENVLLSIPVQVHGDVHDWQKLNRAVVTLTDLGLSRSIPPPPESPLLETRCGSEDYAAPEILMGQPYDGRQTDAWALGVLLYCLMEGRLPFDPLPGARGDPAVQRARTPHRIARCEWSWVKYGDEYGEWCDGKGKDLEDAMKCVDALLKRSTRRKPLADVREWPWVKDGIQIDGGLRWVEEEDI